MFSAHTLEIDSAAAATRIEQSIREQVLGTLKRRGAVLGLSGGIDSSVTASLCVRALGKERVFCLFMPDTDSEDDSLRLGHLVAAQLGIETALEPIGNTLTAIGCYERQIQAIRELFPDYGPGWKCKVTLPSILDSERLNISHLTVQSPEGETRSARMTLKAYLGLIAATNFKQRIRKTLEYYHADRLNYAVAGTPNRLEFDQGFYVKQGDGAADIKPIAHLYKSQVYALAEYLGVPEEIRRRPPTTDTFSMPQTQEEFFFALPYQTMDLCLYARNHGIDAAETAAATGLTPEQVMRVYKDIDSKRRATRYLHTEPLLIEEIPEV